MNKNEEIIYFELNNWSCGRDYPDDEPFVDWLIDDLKQAFQSPKWVKKNKLCVVHCLIDMSDNYCVTATREWVEKRCPKLLTEYTQFLRDPDPEDGEVYGRFDNKFLPYKEENIGIHYQYETPESDEWFDSDFDDWDSDYEDDYDDR